MDAKTKLKKYAEANRQLATKTQLVRANTSQPSTPFVEGYNDKSGQYRIKDLRGNIVGTDYKGTVGLAKGAIPNLHLGAKARGAIHDLPAQQPNPQPDQVIVFPTVKELCLLLVDIKPDDSRDYWLAGDRSPLLIKSFAAPSGGGSCPLTGAMVDNLNPQNSPFQSGWNIEGPGGSGSISAFNCGVNMSGQSGTQLVRRGLGSQNQLSSPDPIDVEISITISGGGVGSARVFLVNSLGSPISGSFIGTFDGLAAGTYNFTGQWSPPFNGRWLGAYFDAFVGPGGVATSLSATATLSTGSPPPLFSHYLSAYKKTRYAWISDGTDGYYLEIAKDGTITEVGYSSDPVTTAEDDWRASLATFQDPAASSGNECLDGFRDTIGANFQAKDQNSGDFKELYLVDETAPEFDPQDNTSAWFQPTTYQASFHKPVVVASACDIGDPTLVRFPVKSLSGAAGEIIQAVAVQYGR